MHFFAWNWCRRRRLADREGDGCRSNAWKSRRDLPGSGTARAGAPHSAITLRLNEAPAALEEIWLDGARRRRYLDRGLPRIRFISFLPAGLRASGSPRPRIGSALDRVPGAGAFPDFGCLPPGVTVGHGRALVAARDRMAEIGRNTRGPGSTPDEVPVTWQGSGKDGNGRNQVRLRGDRVRHDGTGAPEEYCAFGPARE